MEHTSAPSNELTSAIANQDTLGYNTEVDDNITLTADQIFTFVVRLIEQYPDQIPHFISILQNRIEDF
jgi:hypothetical protein